MMVVWRSAILESGGWCVLMIGTMLAPVWPADSWGSIMQASLIITRHMQIDHTEGERIELTIQN